VNYTTEQGLANNSVFSIAEDKSGNLWFGTYGGGVSKYDGNSFVNYTTEQGLANNSVRSIAEDKSGNLWFGTYGGGVSKYDGNSFVNYTTEQGLANNYVFSIAEDKSGNLWFGTYGGGVSLLKAEMEEERAKLHDKNDKVNTKNDKVNTTKEVFLTYTTANGLPDNGICALRFDKKGSLIVGTNFGLAVIPEQQVMQMASTQINGKLKKLTVYNQFTGYPIRDVNTGQNNGTMHVDGDGILWVGHGSNGVTRVNLDAVNKSTAAPNVVINTISLKGEDVCFYSLGASLRGTKQSAPNNEIASSATLLRNDDSTVVAQQEVATYGKVLSQAERDTLSKRFAGITFDGITKFYPLPENLVLPYAHNALTFEFNAIETGRNFMVNYQYMLKGMDDTWSPITKKADATYNNLSEGNYTFLLKAQSPWGVWSEPIEFKFKVLPPWYRTWWAYTIYVLLFVLLVWQLIRLQTRRLKQRQKELETEVDNATKEIRAQKEVVEKQKAIVEEAHKEITDSINYAERIQRSFLATKQMLDANLNEYFVFFQPKEAVSGDFYWAGKLANGNFAIVNADSTGHGVPGAIMSILNISSIESAVKDKLTKPADVFNETRKLIIERLKKDGSPEGGKDGMDASLISINANKTKMAYVAAQNPIWVIRNGELTEIKPEKMPVGKHENDTTLFEGGEYDLQKGDLIYTLTDGFQDQFGGPKGKKFMVKKMREYILSISHISLDEQHQKITEVFANWKGSLDQVDDVCVIGMRI
jgi:serine phosphatase RsbU (regulator of sigma subunit)